MDINRPASIQRHGARFARKNGHRMFILEYLHWPLLNARKTNYRLVDFYKAVNNQSVILNRSHPKAISLQQKLRWNHITYIPLTCTNPWIYSFPPTYLNQLEPAVSWLASQTNGWLLPTISLAGSSIITFSHDSPATTRHTSIVGRLLKNWVYTGCVWWIVFDYIMWLKSSESF